MPPKTVSNLRGGDRRAGGADGREALKRFRREDRTPKGTAPRAGTMAGKRTDLPYRDLEHPFFTEAYQVEAGT